MKKVLFIATVVQKHINVFHLPLLKMFKEDGYQTYVAAANDTGQKDIDVQYCDQYVEIMFARNPLQPKNIGAFLKLKKLINDNEFDIIHCHTPVGGLLGRIAARSSRKNGTKVFYTAHGFHFYKGAPLKNWLLYYSAEKICSHFTDVLITINQEDYNLAQKKMKAKQIEYIPGVGIDVNNIKNMMVNCVEKRREIGVPENAFLIISVGELNKNKNHQVVLKAMSLLKNPNIHYIIAGEGTLRDDLIEMATSEGLKDNVHLLGYRKDVIELYKVSDVFCCPSIREGLSVSLMEAMASGLPCIVSKIRGNTDLLLNTEGGFLCDTMDASEYAKRIELLLNNVSLRDVMGKKNLENIVRFSKETLIKDAYNLYFQRM